VPHSCMTEGATGDDEQTHMVLPLHDDYNIHNKYTSKNEKNQPVGN